MDLASRRMGWSPALERLHGIPEGSFPGTLEAYRRYIHPDDRDHVLGALAGPLDQHDRLLLEYRILRPDGAVRWLEATGRLLADDAGRPRRVVGMCLDVSERKANELSLRAREAWLSAALAGVCEPVIATDTEGLVRYMNPLAEQLTAWSQEEAVGHPIDEVYPLHDEASDEPIACPVEQIVRDGAVRFRTDRTVLRRRDKSELAVDDGAAPINDALGGARGVVVVVHDVTEQRLAEARRRFVVEAGRLLASALDYEGAMKTVAQLAVPRVADWCAVDVVEERGSFRRIAVAHVDPEKVALANLYHQRYPPDPDGTYGLHAVLRSGRPQLLAAVRDELLVSAARDPEHLAVMRSLGVTSYMLVPIIGKSGVLGVVSFVTAESRRTLGTGDLQVAEELCNYAAIAMENSRLYRTAEEARHLAEKAAASTAALQATTAALAAAMTRDDVVGVAIARLAAYLPGGAAGLYLADGGELRLAGHYDRGLTLTKWPVLAAHAPYPVARAFEMRQPLWYESRDELLRLYPGMRAIDTDGARLGSLFALPLASHDAALGGLVFALEAQRSFPREERELLAALADQVSQALERTRLIDELRETVRLNEMFSGVLAHDLRNPLSAIMTATQLAGKLTQDERLRRPLERIFASGERMARMIEQLLDFTRARLCGGLPVDRRRVELVAVCKQVIGELEVAHPDRRIVFSPKGDTRGEWDPDRLAQVISNLVANAIQHGAQGSPIVVDLNGAAADTVTLKVTNAGEVSPESLPHVFEPFRRVDGRERKGGLGLGLHITREVVRAHGGTITIVSDNNETTISVTLPRTNPSAESASA